jgi:hypothetical protein
MGIYVDPNEDDLSTPFVVQMAWEIIRLHEKARSADLWKAEAENYQEKYANLLDENLRSNRELVRSFFTAALEGVVGPPRKEKKR